jgi:hypothetical protein
MNKDLEKKLKENHPEVLAHMWGNPKETCMAWGIECDNGWYDILEKLLVKIDFATKAFTEAGYEVKVTAAQIKEKFGTLSFYYDISSTSKIASEIIGDIVFKAERSSSSICEVTGKHGELCLSGGWYKTLSREKAQEMSYTPAKPEIAKYWESLRAENLKSSIPAQS